MVVVVVGTVEVLSLKLSPERSRPGLSWVVTTAPTWVPWERCRSILVAVRVATFEVATVAAAKVALIVATLVPKRETAVPAQVICEF